MKKISGIYKITNTITNDFYIGSSKNVKKRWADHKCISTWKRCQNSQLYQDMKKYGTDKFEFEILAEVEEWKLKEMEQQFIETLNPRYNSHRAYTGVGAYKGNKAEYKKEHYQKYKEEKKQYDNQLCFYKGETLTLNALSKRFIRQGIPHPVLEAKKYIIKK